MMVFPVLAEMGLGELAVSGVVIAALMLTWASERIRLRARRTPRSVEGPWPTVSVVIPTHNEEKYVGATVRNLKAQVYPGPPIEIIAALNGCTDNSHDAAQRAGARVIESETAGISFGRNLGAQASSGDIIVYVDADTVLPPTGIWDMISAMRGHEKAVAVIGGRPDRGGPVVQICFKIANFYARRRKASPPGPATAVHRPVAEAIGGFDESLPQGTVTDFIWRAREAGAEYIWVRGVFATTSIRRFEKTGIIRQMLAWRKNHQDLEHGRHDAVETRDYEVYR